MKKLGTLLIALILILASAPNGSAAALNGYYKNYSVRVTAHLDRSMEVEETLVYHNSSARSVKISIKKTVPHPEVKNVSVWDSSGKLDFTVETDNSSTTISFRTRWIPARGDYTYHIQYSVSSALGGIEYEYRVYYWGHTFEVKCENFTLTVEGPENTYPFLSQPKAERLSLDPPVFWYSTSFEKGENFGGLSAKFYGHPAYYLITLNYPIVATGDAQKFMFDVIVLNRENTWQFSSIVSSNPQPSTAYFDEDNNLHLVFIFNKVKAGDNLNTEVQLLYRVEVFDPSLPSTGVTGVNRIPDELEVYTQSDNQWWPADNLLILQKVEEIAAGKTDVGLIAQDIVDFVVNHLEYEAQEKRQGALWAYLNSKGDCSEYTDLTISMTRGAGIPARAAYGWGYYEKENLRGHAWVELYLPGAGWIPVDPTWSKTADNYFARLDPIHLTRSIRGIESSESWTNYVAYGQLPSFGELWSITPISESEALPHYLNAVQHHLGLANTLLGGSENEELNSLIQNAILDWTSAQNTDNLEKAITLCERAISNSYEVVAALGKPPTFTSTVIDLYLVLMALFIAGGIAGAGGLIYLKLAKRADRW